MSVTKSYNKHNGTYYAYDTQYVWDETQQKRVQRKRCIGKFDPVTGDIIKNGSRGRKATAPVFSADTVQKMRSLVESKTQGTVEFETEVDPDIIGGFILEYDTFRMDASVKSKLNTILTQLQK